MLVEFVKVSERACLARAIRPDGALIETTATAQDGIPHDLEHLIAEQALGCDFGFWGRVGRGAEFGNFRVTRKGPRRRPRKWNQELAKGYSGWDEDLVTKVVRMYREARSKGWTPPAVFPNVPTMALLMDPRRRPPAEAGAAFTSEALENAAVALYAAEHEWRDLPIGKALTREWVTPRKYEKRVPEGVPRSL